MTQAQLFCIHVVTPRIPYGYATPAASTTKSRYYDDIKNKVESRFDSVRSMAKDEGIFVSSLSIAGIAALVLLFASGPIVSGHQALAVVIVHGHYGGGYFPHYHYGYYGHYHPHYHYGYYGHYGHYHYHGHGYIHAGKTVMTPHGIYHKGVTVGAY